MAVVGTAGRQVIIYQLDNQPKEFKSMESPLKFQVCVYSLFLFSDNQLSLFVITSSTRSVGKIFFYRNVLCHSPIN